MRYAVPAFLAEAGMLEKFYTDLLPGDYSWALNNWPGAMQPKAMRRLLGRSVPPQIPRSRVRTLPFSSLVNRALSRPMGPHLTRTVLKEGFGFSNALYNVWGCDPSVMQAAKSRCLHVVYEQCISPEDAMIMRRERSKYPDVEPQAQPSEECEFMERNQASWDIADRILVPSPFVWDAAVRCGADARKMVLVPYGISDEWMDGPAAPIPGRVLFVGNVGLRKGVHYLAEAARILKQRGVSVEVRVVGGLPSHMRSCSLFDGPTYVGQIPYSETREEYARADVLIFPTLSDSFGLVQLEAMAYGIPVITTANCGAVVRDTVDGLVVPVCDSQALADSMETIVTDRCRRAEMSRNARSRAKEFSWASYKTALLDAVQ